MSNLHGKIALVTGASRGIGRSIARRLGQEGATIIVNYKTNAEKAQEVVHEIATVGGLAYAIQADVSKVADIQALFQQIEDRFGTLNILVNNAGTTVLSSIQETTEEEYDRVFAVNTKGVFFALQEAAKRMRDGGRIINISSGATVAITPGFGVYAATKGAIEQFTYVLARELGARGITVNAVLPGLVETEGLVLPPEELDKLIASTPLGRMAQSQDIADIVAYLASEQSRWITGQAIRAAGGLI